jgi:hypothetical protein
MTRVTVTAIVMVLLGSSVGLIACFSTETGNTTPPPVDATDARATQPAEIQDEGLIPCGPRTVLRSVCQRCHQNPPIRGAPFPLVTRSNIARSNIRERMIAQLTQRRMPARPETIDETSRSTLLEWLEQGAPALAVSMDECTSSNDGGDEAAAPASSSSSSSSM